ncbi:hypothetical protein LA374_00405 [Aeromonas schubertii]|uniref:Uncharacterized protein n=1 Tax=Aeromonas schubertii TaxID=652 RepID=A0ABS7V6W3_9GAMM|nr:hypothetical protein [Aeromonas schubertii]MBZ6064679.1 hypothetical protein [Aeromonas schubertii]
MNHPTAHNQAGTLPASLSCIITTCQHCRQTAVCRPVPGRYGTRAYWYCVEQCYTKALNASERTVRAASAKPASPRPPAQGFCNCCGDLKPLRAVRLRTGWTSLQYCDGCYSDRLAEFDDVPTCDCGTRLRPSEYRTGRCGVCQ